MLPVQPKGSGMSWSLITALGGVLFTIPAAVAIALWLSALPAGGAARRWVMLFSGTVLLVLLSKILFIGWGIGVRALDFTGFSGHATRAFAVLPVLCYLAVLRFGRATRYASVVLGALLAVAVGVSRYVLHAHSISEIVAGSVLGAIVAAACLHSLHTLPPAPLPAQGPRFRSSILAGLAIAVALPLCVPAPTQRWLVATTLFLSAHDRPYTRSRWQIGAPSSERKPAGYAKFSSSAS